MDRSALLLAAAALTATFTSARAEVTPSPLSVADFQAYVLDVVRFAERVYDVDEAAAIHLPLHGVDHILRADWSDGRVRVYHRAADDMAEGGAFASYVISIRGTRLADRSDWGGVLRDLQAANYPVRATDVLLGEGGASDTVWVGWGFQRMTYDYFVGPGLSDAGAASVADAPGRRLLADIDARLAMGEAVEVVVTGHGLGAGAGWLVSDTLVRHFDRTHPDAPLHVRSFAFNGPAAVGAGFARRFTASMAQPGPDGLRRLQAFSFTRAGDIVSGFGRGPGAVLHPAVPAAGDIRLRAADGADAGACTHLELPARHRLKIYRNHLPAHVTADLKRAGRWSDAAECMARPGGADAEPGFETFWSTPRSPDA